MKTLIDIARKNKTLTQALGFVFIVLLIGIILAINDKDKQPEAFVTTATSPDRTTPTTGGTAAGSEVPPIDCDALLTSDEIYEALGAFDNEDLGGGSSGLSKNEVCTETLSANEDYFVQIGPGSPNDFLPSAQLIGTGGTEVTKVGDAALWFGGPGADGGGKYGVITVREDTQHGALHFRVLIGRPDVDEATQRETAIKLANIALVRFPGAEIEPPPELHPEMVTFENEGPIDSSDASLGDYLLAKEARGEWTRGEGLVAALGLMAGEVEASQILDQTELLDHSATLVILLAREYLETGDDAAAKDEIEGLLDRLTLSSEELEQMTGEVAAASLFVSAIPMAQEEGDDPCQNFSMENPCITRINLPDRAGVPTGKYLLYAALNAGSAWTIGDVEAAKVAVLDAAQKYEPLGEMPQATVVLQPGGVDLYVDYLGPECVAYVDEFLAAIDDNDFQQVIAREMAYCLLAREFNQLIKADPSGTTWWVRGLVNYLSGYVYPSTNFEHDNLPTWLAGHELSSTLPERGYTNWVFFEYLHSVIGVDGNLANITGFPVGGDHPAALAAYSGMPELFHDFERALTDANVPDQGPGTVPYNPQAWELPIGGPTEATFTIPPFGVRRLHITIPEGEYGCFETFQTGDQRSSWRPGAPGEPGTWEDVPPVVLEGETMLVLTAVKPGAEMTLDVSEVSDDPNCEEEEESPPTTLGECGFCPPSLYYYNP